MQDFTSLKANSYHYHLTPKSLEATTENGGWASLRRGKNEAFLQQKYIQQYREMILKSYQPLMPQKALDNCLTTSEKFRKAFVFFWNLENKFTVNP
jgi:hypothetical protein